MRRIYMEIIRIINTLEVNPKILVLLIALPFALAFNSFSQDILNQAYAASKFPVPYYVGQLAFDGVQIKQYYAYMIEHGTLGVYVHTQIIDFAFILSTLLLHAVVLLILVRMQHRGGRLSKAALVLFLIAPLAPLFDALENLVSFIMLADPSGFSNPIALVYSSFSAIKFAVFALTYLGAALFFVTGISRLAKQYLNVGTSQNQLVNRG